MLIGYLMSFKCRSYFAVYPLRAVLSILSIVRVPFAGPVCGVYVAVISICYAALAGSGRACSLLVSAIATEFENCVVKISS